MKVSKRKYSKDTMVNCKAMNKTHLKVKTAVWNGFTWMYSFFEESMRCGEEYLTLSKASDSVEELARI